MHPLFYPSIFHTLFPPTQFLTTTVYINRNGVDPYPLTVKQILQAKCRKSGFLMTKITVKDHIHWCSRRTHTHPGASQAVFKYSWEKMEERSRFSSWCITPLVLEKNSFGHYCLKFWFFSHIFRVSKCLWHLVRTDWPSVSPLANTRCDVLHLKLCFCGKIADHCSMSTQFWFAHKPPSGRVLKWILLLRRVTRRQPWYHLLSHYIFCAVIMLFVFNTPSSIPGR